MATMRRRSLLVAVVAAPGSATSTATGPDAALLALCAKATTLDDQSIALMDSTDDLIPGDPAIVSASIAASSLRGDCNKLMAEAANVPAISTAGLQAKAALALREICSDDERHMPLVLSVLRHVAGVRGSQ